MKRPKHLVFKSARDVGGQKLTVEEIEEGMRPGDIAQSRLPIEFGIVTRQMLYEDLPNKVERGHDRPSK